jgi:Protein of unknown function, DUF481
MPQQIKVVFRLLNVPYMTLFVLLATWFAGSLTCIAADQPKSEPDVIVFNNGDQLTGKFVSSAGDSLVFHSDIVGDVTVDWDKVKELRSPRQFAVIETGKHITRKTPDSEIPQGAITATGSDITVHGPATAVQSIPVKNAQFVIDDAAFQKALRHEPGFFHGWTGSAVAGAAFVEATQNSQNFNIGVALARLIPGLTWLAPRNRTIADFTDIYGQISQPGTPTTKTSIYHADAERDEYLTPRFYALVDTSFDHDYSQGLDLQQIYGGGVGYTLVKQAKQELDVKADIHYEHQSFSTNNFLVPPIPAQPSLNLVGSSIGETYWHKLPHGMMLNEAGVVNISFNETNAYSSNVSGALVFPVYKRLSFNLGAVDSYLNNPSVGFKNNSFQFTAGVGYTFH